MKLTPRHVLYGAAIGGSWALRSPWWLAVFVPAAWVVCAYLWPYAPCWACRGRKTNEGSSKKRFGSCPVCGGSGSREVLGSKTVRRAIGPVVKFRKEKKEKQV